VSTLWTPSGEHEPRPGEGEGAPPQQPPGAAGAPPPSGEPVDEATRAQAEAEMQHLREELSSTPVADIIANHVVGLWQLAVLHLDLEGSGTRRVDQARVAIDAVAALVEQLGEDLGPHRQALEDALAQLRLAYVQVADGDEDAGSGD
jgi:hypothetical protein